jgi:hypothetical protein
MARASLPQQAGMGSRLPLANSVAAAGRLRSAISTHEPGYRSLPRQPRIDKPPGNPILKRLVSRQQGGADR